jgi:serine/threonine protein kinase
MHPLDPLGELLVQIQLLREEQWRQACQGLGADDDLDAVLGRMQVLPAWWACRGSTPALTDYQRKWIKRLYGRDRTARLKKALRWDNYLILDEVGEGGMGVVYKAWDLPEGRLVAIKRIKGGSAETYRRFRREARIQKYLSHPRIAHFLKLVRSRRATLLVLEYIEGRTISQEVKARGPIPWQEAVRWTMDILHALEYAHRLKIIHRDLKPSNIILQKQPTGVSAKLLDLGLAKCLDPSSMTQTKTKDALTVGDALLGTFEYMAPEQWRGAEEVVPASDIYSLGCTLFFALTGGRPPFVANSLVAYCNAHTNTPPPRLPASQPRVPEALNALLQQMLSKNPAKRRSSAELLKQFGNLLRMGSDARVSPEGAAVDPVPSPHVRPRQAPLPHHTPEPKRQTTFPTTPPVPADDRFAPFPPSSVVNVSGPRAFWRAFLLSRGLFSRVFFILLVVLVIAGVLALFFHS